MAEMRGSLLFLVGLSECLRGSPFTLRGLFFLRGGSLDERRGLPFFFDGCFAGVSRSLFLSRVLAERLRGSLFLLGGYQSEVSGLLFFSSGF
jgi:hypothetical protein